MEPTVGAKPWQRLCAVAAGGLLLLGCIVAVLVPLRASFLVAAVTSSGTVAGAKSVSVACGSDILGKDYTEASATALIGPGRAFPSNADYLNRACDKARLRRAVRVVPLFASGVVLVLLGWLWPRRPSIRWTGLIIACVLGLTGVLIPFDGTLGW